jgi:hypothetical protein
MNQPIIVITEQHTTTSNPPATKVHDANRAACYKSAVTHTNVISSMNKHVICLFRDCFRQHIAQERLVASVDEQA